MTPDVVLAVASAILALAGAFAFGWWIRDQAAETDHRYLAEIHQIELDREFQRGRRYGQHEPHSCDGQCFNAALTHLTQRTSTTPEWN